MTGNNTEIHDLVMDLCTKLSIPEYRRETVLNFIVGQLPSTEETSTVISTIIRTGFEPLDYLAYPLKSNSRINIFGRNGSGKTAMIVHIIEAMAQNHSIEVLWLDSTFRLNAEFFKTFNLTNINFLSVASITKDIIDTVSSGRYRLIIVDDVASFKNQSTSLLDRLFYISRIMNIMVISANQIREIPSTGRIYEPKQELIGNYDLSFSTSTHAVNYAGKYKDFDFKLIYHHMSGIMDGRSVVVPITNRGFIKRDLLSNRIKRIVEADGFSTLDEALKERIHEPRTTSI